MTSAATISSSSDRHSRLISDLCTIVVTLITPTRVSRVQEPVREWPVTPGAIAALLLGASFAMMVCGSLTFMLGFMLMPWVIGFVMLFCFAGFVSCLGLIWRGVFSTTQKQLPDIVASKITPNRYCKTFITRGPKEHTNTENCMLRPRICN